MIPVVWLSLDAEIPSRGYWDQAILEHLFSGRLWRPPGFTEFTHAEGPDALMDLDGAVVVLPGSYHRDRTAEINALLAPLSWVLLMVTADEGSFFPWREIQHPNLRVWVQNPRRDRHDDTVRGFPVGWTPVTSMVQWGDKTQDWFFAGQVTNPRRQACVDALADVPGGRAVSTPGFAQGMDQGEYAMGLAAAKVAPCPGGQVTPDTFRVWEALEAGCVPLVDVAAGEWEVPEYWEFLLGQVGFPQVHDWAGAPALMAQTLAAWPANANRVQSWYQGYKRTLAYRLRDDLDALTDGAPMIEPEAMVTVLIPTSPIAAHPSTEIITETLRSVRERLPDAEIIVMCDGVRPEQEHYRAAYEEYLWRLHTIAKQMGNVWMQVHDKHLHQAGMTRWALGAVQTPAVLFVEHDTPLIGEIPMRELVQAVLGEADMVRLHHEASVLDPHRHLMLDERPREVCGVPMLRTVQFSARPHVANTGWYRRVLEQHFPPGHVGMVEDVLHGVVQDAWRLFGLAGWERFRLWMYAPDGDMKRSGHLNGRGDDPKWAVG